MSEIFLLVSLIGLLKLIIEEAQRKSFWVRLVHGILFATFMFAIHPFCLSVSKITVDKWLADPTILQNASLIVMLDVFLAYLLITANEAKMPDRRFVCYYGHRSAVANLLHRVIPFLPPLLAIPAVFYLRIVSLFVWPGIPFLSSTIGFAILLFVVITFSSPLAKFLRLHRESLKESCMLLSLSALAIIVGAGVVTIHPTSYTQVGIFPGTLGLILLILLGAVVGYFIFILKNKLKKN